MYIKVLLPSSYIPPHILTALMDQEDLIIPQVGGVVVLPSSQADPALVALHILQLHRQQSAWKIRTTIQF
jgi:hypothetical protein